jgi:hypothetical protein
MFFEGIIFPVKDINSFRILDYSFAKDRISGYYMRVEIAGTDGNTFTVLDDHYSKDKTHVYYSNIKIGENNTPPLAKSTALEGAIADSFNIIDAGYASDTRHIYYNGDVLTDVVQNFKVLPYDYAKNETQVFYMGKPVEHADAPTFVILDHVSDSADAKDKYFFYQQGRKIKQ